MFEVVSCKVRTMMMWWQMYHSYSPLLGLVMDLAGIACDLRNMYLPFTLRAAVSRFFWTESSGQSFLRSISSGFLSSISAIGASKPTKAPPTALRFLSLASCSAFSSSARRSRFWTSVVDVWPGCLNFNLVCEATSRAENWREPLLTLKRVSIHPWVKQNSVTSLPWAGFHVGRCAVDMAEVRLVQVVFRHSQALELVQAWPCLYGNTLKAYQYLIMTTTSLLPFHKSVLSAIHSPETSDLLLLARGLGLRRVVCTLMQIYESPQNLVLLVNATPSEETGIGDELNIMGCRKPGLRIVTYEMSSKDRYEVARLHRLRPHHKQNLYRGGGPISVTSRILQWILVTRSWCRGCGDSQWISWCGDRNRRTDCTCRDCLRNWKAPCWVEGNWVT